MEKILYAALKKIEGLVCKDGLDTTQNLRLYSIACAALNLADGYKQLLSVDRCICDKCGQPHNPKLSVNGEDDGL